MQKRLLSLLLALALGFSAAVPAARADIPPPEPGNMSRLKQEINDYVKSGNYGKGIAIVAGEAGKYLTKRIAKGPKKDRKLAVVFDIDETTLSNLRHIQANDYGYIPKVWDAWVAEAQAIAIYPVQGVYDIAVRGNVDVFFITGRTPKDAPGTEKNLREVGYEKWTKIFYKPADFTQGTRAFKIDTRRYLESQGYTIVLNIGDQDSDLIGGYAERTFKLPNPFYITN